MPLQMLEHKMLPFLAKYETFSKFPKKLWLLKKKLKLNQIPYLLCSISFP